MPTASGHSSRKKPQIAKLVLDDLKRSTAVRRSRKTAKRSKDIERALRLVWDSLESHLDATHRGVDMRFHRQCVKEYAEVIHILSRLY